MSSAKDDVDSIFIKEWFAARCPPHQLPISAVCNSHCLFCSNDLNPFQIERGFFRDIEDIKLQLTLMPPHKKLICMSDSLPGRIAEGEAFLHPQFFKILELVRQKYLSNTLCFTTNASMLDESFLKSLYPYRPVEIKVSMHSTKPELWAHIFGRNETDARRAINSLQLIKKYRCELAGTIVPLPNICGWGDVERTYSHFVSHGASHMTLFWPGYTSNTPHKGVKQLECQMEEFMDFSMRMGTRYKIPMTILPDMKNPLGLPVAKIMSKTMLGNFKNNCGRYHQIVWLASEAAHERLGQLITQNASSYPNRHIVFPVKNLAYGGNIICAGLLMVADFIAAGKKALECWPDTDLILIPDTPFDALYRDLQKVPAYKISEALKRPLWMVDDTGGIDPMLTALCLRAG